MTLPTANGLLAVAVAEPTPHVFVVRLCGELDMSSAPALHHVLDPLVSRAAPRRFVLDLSGLRFLGSPGISMLVELRKRTAAPGPAVLRLAGPSPATVRVLTMTGVLGLFTVHDNVEDALAGTDAPRADRPAPP
ncbi:STAS domain-containing protein [Pseudonocardia lacus]|uniref:STAS domain-containing protein n=1 Tax=Pseudonocardia lacus TaxID=2835865 RepID=UPI001BDDB1F8|nr:STAS domain-containing protein [Pseudonocardia lacus]